jgi:Tfp pilus assembly protein PilF
MQDIFAVEDSISQRIVAALIPNAGRLEREQLKQKYTSSIDARNVYLKGRYYWAKRTPESVQKAIDCFAGAIQLDPHYAMAYAGLADAYAVTASGLPLSERILKAKSAAAKALAIDDSLAEAHTSLAFILYKFEWAWAKAESHFRRAIELNPSYALAHHWFGEFLILRGKFDEGLAELRQAEALDPLSLPIANDVARGLYRARRYDEAIAQSRRALELDADFRNAYSTLVYAYEQKRDYAKAVGAELEVLRVSNVPAGKIAELQKVFAMSGWKAFWRSELNWMKGEKRMLPAYVSAELNTRIGDSQAAMRDLERSYEEHGDAPLLIGVEPLLDGLRRDARFAELVRRSGVIAF